MKNKQMSAVMLGLAWMASLGVVFVLGILSAFAFHLKPGAGDTGTADLTLEQRELKLVLERYTGSPADLAEVMGMTDADGLPEQVEQALRAIMRSEDREERQMAARLLVRGLPPRRMMAAIRFLQGTPAAPGRDQVLGGFLEHWALQDGRRAIAFATSLASASERELAIRAVLRGWSHGQLADAWNWVVESAGSSRRAERWLEEIISNITAADTATAFNLLERLPASDFQNQMAVVAMDQILKVRTPREAVGWLSEFPAKAAPVAAAYLAQNWAITDPQAAVSWLHGAYPDAIEGLGQALREWVSAEPEGAADWAWAEFSGSNRRFLMDVVAAEWIGNDGPAPLAEWLNSHGPDVTLDGAIQRLALATVAMDPATALYWTQSIMDPDERSMLEILIGRQWIRMDPDAAAQSLPVLLESDSARAALLQPEEEPYYLEPAPVPAEPAAAVEEELPPEEATEALPEGDFEAAQ